MFLNLVSVGLIFSSSMKRPGPGMAGPMPNNMPVMSHESLLMLIGKIKVQLNVFCFSKVFYSMINVLIFNPMLSSPQWSICH